MSNTDLEPENAKEAERDSEILSVEQALVAAAEKMNAEGVYCGHGTDNTWDEACLLLLHSMGLESADESILQESLAPEIRQNFQQLVMDRIETRLPAAYLIGEAEFAGLRFKVDQRVLVPRSPFAELIFKGFAPWLTSEPKHILDLCTGSGCIGIATAVAFPRAKVVLSDLSAEALEVAESNIQRHGLAESCRAIQGDIFNGLEGQCFDLIVSNPPYVDSNDLASMPEEYKREPELGLAAGADGLDIVRVILAEAADHLNDGGHLIVEVGNSWVAMESVYAEVPFTWIEFEYGGDGVFILTKTELRKYQEVFQSGLLV